MENKKENVKTEIKNEEIENVTEETVQEETHELQVYIERERFRGTDGNSYWSYVLKGKIRGRDAKVYFAPKDKGGYGVLDIVFDVAPKAELVMLNETMTDNSGKKTKYVSYQVRTVDENGNVYACGIKPSRDSDKWLLTMMLNEMKANTAK